MSGIAAALAGIHLGIATISQMPHWMLEKEETEAMSQSVINVARHYPKIAGSQKLVDWTMLIGSLGMVYVPRVMMTRDELAKRKQRAADEAAARAGGMMQ